MYRIFAMGIGIAASAIILIPVLCIMGKLYFRDAKKTFLYTVFAMYLAAVYDVTGLPSVTDFHPEVYVNCIPFVEMLYDPTDSILNVILFVPLGILLPVINSRFRAFRYTFQFGLCMTLLIEFLQLFTYRVTDINDVITNTAGTVIGFCIAKLLLRSFEIKDARIDELYAVCSVVLAVMILVQPFASGFFWKLVL